MSWIRGLPNELLLLLLAGLDDSSALHLSSACKDLEARTRDCIIRRDLRNDGVVILWASWKGCLRTLDRALQVGGGAVVRERLNRPLSLRVLEDRVLGSGQSGVRDFHASSTYALTLACWNGHRRVVEALLALGARVDRLDEENNNTALHHALDDGCARMLVEAGADVNALGGLGVTPLASLIDSAAACLELTDPPHSLPMPQTFSYPSFLATIEYLVSPAGADVDRGPDDRLSPMGMAASATLPEVMEILLGGGAIIPADVGPDETLMETVGRSLELGAAGHHPRDALRMLDLLVAAGADPVDAIHSVVAHPHDAGDSYAQAVAYRAISRCSDLERRNARGETPLMVALRLRHVHVSQILIMCGADPTRMKEWYVSQAR